MDIPGLQLLAKLKRLRGTRFDPFGWGRLSVPPTRTDRVLRENGRDAPGPTFPAQSRSSITIAALPMLIQGFGPVKAARIKDVKALEQSFWKNLANRDKNRHGKPVRTIAAEVNAPCSAR